MHSWRAQLKHPPMAEVEHQTPQANMANKDLVPPPPGFRSPPPKNDLENPFAGKASKPFRKRSIACSVVCFFSAFLMMFALSILVWLIVYLATGPTGPSFSVVHVLVKRQQQGLDYDVSLRAKSNDRMGVMTIIEKGVDGTLLFKNQRIGFGKMPAIKQRGNDMIMKMDLYGLNGKLPSDIRKAMQDVNLDSFVSLVLRMNVPVKVNALRVANIPMAMDVPCNIKVKLGRKTQVMSQKCDKNLKIGSLF